MTVYPAIISFDLRRRKSGRRDMCCCKPTNDESDNESLESYAFDVGLPLSPTVPVSDNDECCGAQLAARLIVGGQISISRSHFGRQRRRRGARPHSSVESARLHSQLLRADADEALHEGDYRRRLRNFICNEHIRHQAIDDRPRAERRSAREHGAGSIFARTRRVFLLLSDVHHYSKRRGRFCAKADRNRASSQRYW